MKAWIVSVTLMFLPAAALAEHPQLPVPVEAAPLMPSTAFDLMVGILAGVKPTSGQEQMMVSQRFLPPRVRTDVTDRAELFYLGEIYFLGFQPREALEAYEQVVAAGKDDFFTRTATARIMQMNFRAFDKPELVAEQMSAFRENYPPAPDWEDMNRTAQQAANFARKYAQDGDNAAVLAVLEEDFASVPMAAPYRALAMPARLYPLLREAGHGARAIALSAQALEGLRAARAKLPGAEAYTRPPLPDGYGWFYDTAASPEQRGVQLDAMIAGLEAFLDCARATPDGDCRYQPQG